MKILIVSVIYLEPEWQETKACIEAAVAASPDEVDVVYVDRKGFGSLSKAFNDGWQNSSKDYLAIWFVTNVTFEPDSIRRMLMSLVNNSLAAVHPTFESDHLHLRPVFDFAGTELVPYIEFTAPFIRAEVFDEFPLDEKMPYWGMDLDWSYRVTQAGYSLACCHAVTLGHTYIRNNTKPQPITLKRRKARKMTDGATQRRLIQKYGQDWRKVLNYNR